MKTIGRSPITGRPLRWSGKGRPPTYAPTSARDLDLYLGYAERAVVELMKPDNDDAERGPFGAFVDVHALRDVARRFMGTSNRIFNAIRRIEADERRRAAQTSSGDADTHSSEKGQGA